MRLAPAILIFIATALSMSSPARAQSNDELRVARIVDAFNAVPNELVKPLTRDQVHLRDGQGRVDVNPDAKFSYFVQTLSPENPASPMLLIPMATSRFTPTYYQTDAWWDAHKAEIEAARQAGTPTPKQDMNEVQIWLEQQKLSTNPPVIEIPGDGRAPIRTPLQDYLRAHLLSHYAVDGVLTLYRGGEKPGEIDAWLAGQKPRGARYWTPTAFYAWRYARKNRAFLEDLVNGRAPLFVFKIPVADFQQMTNRRWPRLTLGTELTKNAHNAFDRSGVFMDHLYNSEYLGEGTLGVEIELRSNSSGAQDMTRYFKGAITIEDLANDRIALLRRSASRLEKARPAQADSIARLTESRIERVLAETRLLVALREQQPREIVQTLIAALPNGRISEIAYIDGVDLTGFAQTRMAALPTAPRAVAMSCTDVFR